MRTTKWQPKPSVIQRLIDEPYRFEFLQAVRLVLGLMRAQGISNERALTQVLRFESSIQLSFPPSEIESLHGGGETEARTDRMLVLAMNGEQKLSIRVTPAFIGFLGVCGVLPLHYSERIALHQKLVRNASARAFMDVFSNRFVGQFYLASRKYRLERSIESEGPDRQFSILLSLAGCTNAGSPSDNVQANYSTLFRTRPASAFVIARALTEHFSVPISIVQSVGSWDDVPIKMRSRLGKKNQRLGLGACLGTRLWRHDRRIRLDIGPLDKIGLTRFLPRSATSAALGKLLGLFDIGPIEVEVRLILKPDCARPLSLTTRSQVSPGALGWTTFLTSGAESVKHPELRYLLNLGQSC